MAKAIVLTRGTRGTIPKMIDAAQLSFELGLIAPIDSITRK